MRQFAIILSLVVLALTSIDCRHAPPNLSPAGAQAFYKTRVVKGLDVVRDTAVDANSVVPPLVSENLTRKVVTFHKSALLTMQASTDGWKATVQTGLGELLKDVPPGEAAILQPYVLLVKTILAEVQ